MSRPQFPENPAVGQIYPGTPVPGQTQYIYTGEHSGWAPREVQLQKKQRYGKIKQPGSRR